jgi:IS30 family transposase
MHNPTQYRRLAATEREELSRGLAQGETLSAIARRLGRAPSTISREVNHNRGKTGYRAFSAHRRASASASSRRRGKSRLANEDGLRQYVLEKLQKRWSSREIVKRMREEYPLDMGMRISHETIYRYIYVLPRGSLKQTLIKALRQERAYRRKQKRRNVEETRGKIADMLSIEERPPEIADRTIPGH